MSKTETKKRFRFSIRAMLILLALIAITAGLIGRPVNNYLRENRIAKRLEDAGADIKLEIVPPTGDWMERFLYRIGYRSAFRRIVRVNFAYGDTFSDELAEQLAGLPSLSGLGFGSVPVSNKQLKSLSRSRSLRVLGIRQETKKNAWARQLNSSVPTFSVPKMPPPALDDDGVLVLLNHPSLQNIVLHGCHVSNAVYGQVLQSLASNRDPQEEEEFPAIGFGSGSPVEYEAYVDSGLSRLVAAELVNRRSREIQSSGVRVFAKNRTRSMSNADVLVLKLQANTMTDFTRLQYVLPTSAKWELHLSSDFELGDSELKSLLFELRPYATRIVSIEAFGGTPELPAILEVCPELDELRIHTSVVREVSVDPVLMLPYEVIHSAPSVSGFERDVVDDYLDNLTSLKKLKRLHIPNAAITSIGLQKLIEADLKLDEIHLPDTFREFVPRIKQSGLAKSVSAFGRHAIRMPRKPEKLTFSDSAVDSKQLREHVGVIRRFSTVLKHASFPRPNDSPRRAEDVLLADQRREILSLVEDCDEVSPKLAIELIEETFAIAPASQLSVEDLIDQLSHPQPHELNSFQSELHDDAMKHQTARLFGCLAQNYESMGEIEKALESRVRQLAWWPPKLMESRPLHLNQGLADLCHKPSESPLAKKLRKLLFLQAKEEQTEYSVPVDGFADIGRGNFVPMLAPKGSQFSTIRSSRAAFEIDLPSDGRLGNSSGIINVPDGHPVVYIERRFFPVTVSVAKLQYPRSAPFGASELAPLLDEAEASAYLGSPFGAQDEGNIVVGGGFHFPSESSAPLMVFPATTQPQTSTLEPPISQSINRAQSVDE